MVPRPGERLRHEEPLQIGAFVAFVAFVAIRAVAAANR
jgi:hypothetical protein